MTKERLCPSLACHPRVIGIECYFRASIYIMSLKFGAFLKNEIKI